MCVRHFVLAVENCLTHSQMGEADISRPCSVCSICSTGTASQVPLLSGSWLGVSGEETEVHVYAVGWMCLFTEDHNSIRQLPFYCLMFFEALGWQVTLSVIGPLHFLKSFPDFKTSPLSTFFTSLTLSARLASLQDDWQSHIMRSNGVGMGAKVTSRLCLFRDILRLMSSCAWQPPAG